MKVAIIGGTGFVGSYIVDALLDAGHEPHVLVRSGSEGKLHRANECEVTSGDLDSPDAVDGVVSGCDAVIYNVGILREFPREGITFEALQYQGAVTVAEAAKRAVGAEAPLPPMAYRPLGRTGWDASRLVFGCGAALSRRPDDALLEAAFGAGINVFDVGFRGYYEDAEKHLGPFARRKRDRIFLISKAYVPVDVEPDEAVTPAQARAGAAGWLESLEASLRELGVEQLDLLKPIYRQTASGGHFGRSDIDLPWERLDRVAALKSGLGLG